MLVCTELTSTTLQRYKGWCSVITIVVRKVRDWLQHDCYKVTTKQHTRLSSPTHYILRDFKRIDHGANCLT